MLEATLTSRSRLRLLAPLAVLMFSGARNTEGKNPSDSRQHVWAIKIAHLLEEPPGWAQVEHHQTEDLAFSPDGRRLAVTITHKESFPDKRIRLNEHVFVVDVNSPETNFHQYDLSDTCGSDLAWNESGTVLLVCGTLLRLADGTSCDATGLPFLYRKSTPWKAFWLDSEHVVRSQAGDILDMACKQVGSRRLDPAWHIGGVVTSRGWVLVRHFGQNSVCEYSIVDRASRGPVNGWTALQLPCISHMMVAVGANALCFNTGANGRLHCWEINGGKEIRVPKQARDYLLTRAATSSPRIVLEKWSPDRFPWWNELVFWWVPYPGLPPLPRLRVVLDLRSGVWVSSWKPRIQDTRIPSNIDSLYRCALSARGELLAESGDGIVELYRFAP